MHESILSSDRLIFLVRAAGGAPPDAQGLELRTATERDGHRYARDIGTDSPSTFARRLWLGAECYLVVSSGHIAHATWISRTGAWAREIRRCITPPPGDAYVYESFTTEQARGRGLYPLALRAICAHLAAVSDRVWVGVENHNLASLRSVSKAGFQAAAEVPYRKVLGRLIIGRTRSLADDGRATIRLLRAGEAPALSTESRGGGASEASAP
ncbi:hypothetical protein BH24ACT26_BH24ACT26_07470 [soil metagenome]